VLLPIRSLKYNYDDGECQSDNYRTTPNSHCGTGTVVLGATASSGTINWYAAATGGSSLGSGTSFTTPSIAISTTYYVDATASGCTTATRTAVLATINTLPNVTITGSASACSGLPVFIQPRWDVNYIWSVTGGTITAGGTSTSSTATITWTTTEV